MPTGVIPTLKNNNPDKIGDNNADNSNPDINDDSNYPDNLCELRCTHLIKVGNLRAKNIKMVTKN
jgi:hypothetical protein